jgi:SAM-dependent methyltransferase
VLDVGCGVGRWSRFLAARGAQVLGVDLSPTMIAQAAGRRPNRASPALPFCVTDLAHLRWANVRPGVGSDGPAAHPGSDRFSISALGHG